MGDYVVRIQATGGHGCQRDVGHGQKLKSRCGSENCPDCITREYVEKLAKSNSITSASITHWPADLYGTDGLDEVRDDLVTGMRRGSFFEDHIRKPKPTV